MKISVNFSDFCDAFRDMGRNDNFSYEGKRALFDFLEEIEADAGKEIELDVIALCCEYSEMTPEEIADCYPVDLSECEDEEEKKETIREYLNDNTCIVGEVAGGFVFADF